MIAIRNTVALLTASIVIVTVLLVAHSIITGNNLVDCWVDIIRAVQSALEI